MFKKTGVMREKSHNILTFRARTAAGWVLIALLLSGIVLMHALSPAVSVPAEAGAPEQKTFIKWVQFDVPYAALDRALNADIKSYRTPAHVNWVDVLAYLAAKYYGHWNKYKAKDMDAVVQRIRDGERMQDIAKDLKYYAYYREAYGAVLDGFVGEYDVETTARDGEITVWQRKYGLKVFSPIAKGFWYSHYDDFGDSRTYGFRRLHLGNDLMGGVGTPIIAVESGVVEALGWNMYGGWRVGIRSLDCRRYYYYAHMRKDRPYHRDMYVGKRVQAGDVIGYLGMTGYSRKENVNNIKKPHLHFGLQLIFDESQKESVNEIWVDVYDIVRLLQKNRSTVQKNPEDKEYYRAHRMQEPVATPFEPLTTEKTD